MTPRRRIGVDIIVLLALAYVGIFLAVAGAYWARSAGWWPW